MGCCYLTVGGLSAAVSSVTVASVLILVLLGWLNGRRAQKWHLFAASVPFAVGMIVRQPVIFALIDSFIASWWGVGANVAALIYELALVAAMALFLEIAIVALASESELDCDPAGWDSAPGRQTSRHIAISRGVAIAIALVIVVLFNAGWPASGPFMVASLGSPRAALFSIAAWLGLACLVGICLYSIPASFHRFAASLDRTTTIMLTLKGFAALLASVAWVLQMILTVAGFIGQRSAATSLATWNEFVINSCAVTLCVALGFPVAKRAIKHAEERLQERKFLWASYPTWKRFSKKSPGLVLHAHGPIRGRGIMTTRIQDHYHRRKVELVDLRLANPSLELSQAERRMFGHGEESGWC